MDHGDRPPPEDTDLERLLRASRAEPSQEFTEGVTSRIGGGRRGRKRPYRLAIALAVSTMMLTGGALAAKFTSVGTVSKKDVETHLPKPAHHQYDDDDEHEHHHRCHRRDDDKRHHRCHRDDDEHHAKKHKKKHEETHHKKHEETHHKKHKKTHHD